MRHFVTDLTELQNKLLEMGGLVETSIRSSTRSLVERDEALAKSVWDVEASINRMDIDIDDFATRLLATQQPVARDLRFLTAAIKINSDLERMGDLAINIAQRSLSLLRRAQVKPLIDMGAEVIIPAGGLPMLLFARESPFIIDGAPVLNGIAVVAKAAEMTLALKAITKLVVSRRSTYAKASPEAISEFLAR